MWPNCCTVCALRGHCVHLPGNSPKITYHMFASTAKQQSPQDNNQHMRGHMGPMPNSCTACMLRTQRLGYSPKNTCHLSSSTAKQQSPHENNENAFKGLQGRQTSTCRTTYPPPPLQSPGVARDGLPGGGGDGHQVTVSRGGGGVGLQGYLKANCGTLH